MKIRLLKVSIASAIALGLATSPYNVNLGEDSISIVQAQENKSSNLVFYSSDKDLDKTLEKAINKKDDDFVEGIKHKVEKSKLNFEKLDDKNNFKKMSSATALAFDINEVRNDSKLINVLKTELQNGKRIYLFGGLTLKEYSELLDVELKVTLQGNQVSKEINLTADITDEKATDDTKKTDDTKHDIVGYTLKDEPVALYTNSISKYNEDESLITNTEQDYLESILKKESVMIDEKTELNQFGFIKKNTASAAQVKRASRYDLTRTVKNISTTVGEYTTQWFLYQELSETDYTYDDFAIQDETYVDAYNGYRAIKMTIKHSFPYSPDEWRKSRPLSDSDGSYSYTLGYPWGISGSFTISAEPNISRTYGTAEDWINWTVTDYNLESSNEYIMTTAWGSTGTLAAIDVNKAVTFKSGIDHTLTGSQYFTPRYDYTTRNQ
ncbi:hypothetical protein [Rossellomorea aquimaris]|uniref:hypothetical protein n=1 Tax=Rossellomorea aquimaris TaxID=189382 RepID=UPI0007D0A4E6|nr:hypothetical protein [Rossellomorea aquimaris]